MTPTTSLTVASLYKRPGGRLLDTGRVMSQQNVETVRRSWQAFGDGGLDALMEYFDQEVKWRAIEGAPDDVGEMNGKDALRRYLQDWLDTFEGITTTPTEVIDAGDDLAVAALHVTGRARLSGIETELRYAVVYTVRDGRITRGREYAVLDEALKAADAGGTAGDPGASPGPPFTTYVGTSARRNSP
jgi:ketosteroid isomerase-like protein